MNQTTFFRGLLYALRDQSDEAFTAEGDRFHRAFRTVLEEAASRNFGPARQMLANYDPVFGIYPDATEMLLEAQRDFIVTMMNPHLRKAQFKITKGRARAELKNLPNPTLFRKLARTFHAGLSA